MPKKINFLALAIFISLNFSQKSLSAESNEYSTMSLEDLLNLEIKTGSFLDLNLDKSPLSMTIIDRKQIKDSGSRTLSELLEIYVPGFQYMYNKWNGDIWGMRGIAADRNTKFIFSVNGIKLNQESRDGAIAEATLGLFDDIERIEVIRGPSGLVYGSGAIAGVINLVTRKSDKNSGSLSYLYGNTNGNKIEASAHSKISDKESIGVSFGFRAADGLGLKTSRLFGNNSWPNNGGLPSANGNLTDGSAWMTPGNIRFGVDWNFNNFDLYARFTRQRQNSGAFFIVDPWPEVTGEPKETDGSKIVDGKTIPFNDPLSKTESYGTNRREYFVDNILINGTYRQPIDTDELKLSASFIGATNRIQFGFRPDYQLPDIKEKANLIDESLGDKRYLGNIQYLMKRIDNLQSALGVEFRLDNLGPDLEGLNVSNGGVVKRPAISNITYTNLALYTENYYNLNTNIGGFGFVGGLRVDKHTRTDFVFNPKLAALYSPNKDNTFKIILQSSSNNGSADNYEFNRNHFREDGSVSKEPFLKDNSRKDSDKVLAVTQEQLQSLKPEKIMSYELTSNHKIGNFLTFIPSLSYNNVSDLFVWNQTLLRVVNGDPFNFINAEADIRYQNEDFLFGASHTFQRPVNTPIDSKINIKVPKTEVIVDPNNKDKYKLNILPETENVSFNPTKDQITSDGNNFINLSTNVSKLYLTYKPNFAPFITLHTNLRAFWALSGRTDLYKEDEKKGFNYLNITSSPMFKWNTSLHCNLPENFMVSFYAYDILGQSDNLNAVRWQQSAFPDQKDLYTVDQRSFAIKLEKNF